MLLISQSGPVDYLLAYVTNSKAGTFIKFRLIKLDTLNSNWTAQTTGTSTIKQIKSTVPSFTGSYQNTH